MPKISFTTMATPELNAIQAIRAARKYGYDGIDLRISEHKGEITSNTSANDMIAIRQALEFENIQLSSLLCYNEIDKESVRTWTKMKETISKNLYIAEELCCGAIRIFEGPLIAYKEPEEYLKRTADTICQILNKKDLEVDILIQNHISGFSVIDVIKLLKLIDNPKAGMVFSPDHCMILNENIKKYSMYIKRFTRQLYIADIKKVKPQILHVLPGMGNVCIREAYQIIGGREFTGWTTFKWEKIWNKKLEDYKIALPYFIKYFKESIEN